MSIRAMGHVWELEGLPPLEKWLLVVLSDYADDNGDSIFPSLDTIMKRSQLSRATVQRLLKRLVVRGHLEHAAASTPFSPAFYRILGIPEIPIAEGKGGGGCPNTLRNAVIFAFQACCEYCRRTGTIERDPDGRSWCADRVLPGKRGGRYIPDNVTLACAHCNVVKKDNPAPAGTRTLSHVHPGGLPQRPRGVSARPPLREEGEVSESNLPGSHAVAGGGLPQIPDPLSDPSSEEEHATPLSPDLLKPVENPPINFGLLLKFAHEVMDGAPSIGDSEIERDVEQLCINRRVPWDRETVWRAVRSAQGARRRQGATP